MQNTWRSGTYSDTLDSPRLIADSFRSIDGSRVYRSFIDSMCSQTGTLEKCCGDIRREIYRWIYKAITSTMLFDAVKLVACQELHFEKRDKILGFTAPRPFVSIMLCVMLCL